MCSESNESEQKTIEIKDHTLNNNEDEETKTEVINSDLETETQLDINIETKTLILPIDFQNSCAESAFIYSYKPENKESEDLEGNKPELNDKMDHLNMVHDFETTISPAAFYNKPNADATNSTDINELDVIGL